MEKGEVEKANMYRRTGSVGASIFLALLLVAGMLLVMSRPATATPTTPAQIGNPLPNNCSDITEPGEDPPACCAFGYVYYNSMPVAGAQVVIRSAGGVFTTTSTGPSSIDPYYASALSNAPLNVSPGETITLTASHSDATASVVYQVVAGGQQVDVVIPAAGGDQPPIATIHYIHPNPANQRTDTITFAGAGAAGAADGTAITAWEWSSDLGGGLSTQEDFQQPAYNLTTGEHTISFRVQDAAGNWSAPVMRPLTVEPMAFDLHTGWQVIVLPALPDANYDARQLLEDIAAQDGCPAGLSRWLPELSNWGSYVPELPFGNFGVIPWHPYFLRATCPSALRLPAGFSIAPPEVIALTAGWNFVIPPPTAETLTAELACEQITAQGGAVSEIARWAVDVGDWAGHICGQPFGDFELTPDQGYFLRSQMDSAWRPGGDSMSVVHH